MVIGLINEMIQFQNIFLWGGRNTSDKYIFKKPIVGVCTNRDTWIYGSSIRQIERNINRTTEAYSMAKNIYKASAKIKLA